MSRFQDFARVAVGLALVARESIELAPSLRRLKEADFEGSATVAAKSVLNVVMDAAGLTRGLTHKFKSKFMPEENFTHKFEAKDMDKHNFDVSRTREAASKDLTTSLETLDVVPSKESAISNSKNEGMTTNQPHGFFLADESDRTGKTVSKNQEEEQVVLTPAEGSIKQSAVSENQENEQSVMKPLEGSINQASGTIEKEFTSGTNFPHEKMAHFPTTSVKHGAGLDFRAQSSMKKRKPRERRVPSTPFGRVLGFAGLGAGLAWGTLQESVRKALGVRTESEVGQSALSSFLSEQNAERLALGLCRMRGAALKLGQMLSIQDESLVPPQVLQALEVVRQGADVMPKRQLYRVLASQFGQNWRDHLESFEDEPLASASIGQVHRAVLKDGTKVAMKVQYPGVADSIDSDIENVKRLLDYTNLIPKGLYLEQAIKVAKQELARECDYELEAANQKKYRELATGIDGVYVPRVYDAFCSKRVLTTELVPGVSIDKVAQLEQNVRNDVATRLLNLTLKELFEFRFMQTDPNWSNFLYDEETNTINLIDFGAVREYPKHFVDSYLEMVLACANKDTQKIIEMSCKLGFLTGKESTVMLDAHTEAALMVGLPFAKFGGYDFHRNNPTRRVSDLGVTMLKHRLTPPPEEVYSLHRKLSGAFLACIKLRSVVHCREMLLEVYEKYKFSEKDEEHESGSLSLASA